MTRLLVYVERDDNLSDMEFLKQALEEKIISREEYQRGIKRIKSRSK